MSKSRTVKTHFWNDNFVGQLQPDDKLLFLYLITNPLTNMLGVYEIQLRRISFDTMLPLERVTEGLETLRNHKKAEYIGGYIILPNFVRNQNYNTNMLKSAANEMEDLPSCVLKSPFFRRVREWFERVPERSAMVPKIEVEREVEVEVERERETEEENETESRAGRESEPFPKRLEKADTRDQLFRLWFDYRKSKGRHPTPFEEEALKKEWEDIPLNKIKASISYTVSNGWFSLQNSDSKSTEKDTDHRPNAGAYEFI